MAIKEIVVKGNTRLADLKEGDLVMTAEIHRVVSVNGINSIVVGQHTPRCRVCELQDKDECTHPYVKSLGWGQQSIAKILKIKR